MKSKNCNQHPTCSASDSYLPLCKCWCAECKDIMKEARLNHYYFRADRIATHATATARQLFTADGRLIKGGN